MRALSVGRDIGLSMCQFNSLGRLCKASETSYTQPNVSWPSGIKSSVLEDGHANRVVGIASFLKSCFDCSVMNPNARNSKRPN